MRLGLLFLLTLFERSLLRSGRFSSRLSTLSILSTLSTLYALSTLYTLYTL
jgi:hypothetical protein